MITVCIVEDISEIREGFQTIMNMSEDIKCIGAFHTGEDAISQLPALNPDITIMDINLPGVSGIECIRKLKKLNLRSLYLMFTVYDDDDNVFEALKTGASGYILKKTSPTKFLEAIKEIHAGGSPMSPYIARKIINAFHLRPQQMEKSILTAREEEVLTLLSKGLLYKEVAETLFISVGTVKQHIHKIYDKLHVQNKTEAINKFFKNKPRD